MLFEEFFPNLINVKLYIITVLIFISLITSDLFSYFIVYLGFLFSEFLAHVLYPSCSWIVFLLIY